MEKLLNEHHYEIQEDLRCCGTCPEHDTVVDSYGTEYLMCTVYGDPVHERGICDIFSFE